MTTLSMAPVKVMIVEDYKLTRVGLRCALNQHEDIEVINEAENAEDALKMIEQKAPDVVIMDLGLPDMNGLEATMKIMENNTNKKDIKVIILTSHDREEEVIASLGAGATGYCMKDIDPDTLADVIKQVNQGACWLDPNVCKTALKIFPRPENTQLIYKQETKDDKGHLTEREQEVLRLLVKGKSNTEIASELIVSVHTAKAHVCSILQKLCVDDRVQAAVKAIKEGLVDENSTK
ncbi:TPA: response regulator transcription factor [Candidatus Galligastranaerophilus intestinigallinarum]|nr:response regulator transcription factor [Candidatus Galligastranaerophilus intestinigallinarum]